MTAKSSGLAPDLIPGPRAGHGYSRPILSGEQIYNGAVCCLDAPTGKFRESTSALDPSSITYGFARLGLADNADNSGGLYTNDLIVDAMTALVIFSSITIADEGKVCYVVDDQTATLTPGAPIMGIVQLWKDSTHAYVTIDPLVNRALAATSLGGASGNRKCRAVATSIGANTGTTTGTLTVTATGALGAQDGVTLVAGDLLFIQEGTANVAAADAGPWVVSVIGTTGVSAVLVRPPWWTHGGPIVPGDVIEIGGEGTGTNPTLAGTTWKSFVAKAQVIDANAPVFWPRSVSCGVTLASGTLAAARTTIPVRAHLTTGFNISSDPATAPHATTRLWRVSALTVGVTGTSSVQIVAESAPGTTNTSDVGQYNIVATNW